ncbi:unnamed protein product, partial [marine sediment metagenome]
MEIKIIILLLVFIIIGQVINFKCNEKVFIVIAEALDKIKQQLK